jgi:hypothetical protein
MLVLPNGERVSPARLSQLLPEVDLIFVTCFSRDLNPKSAINLREAEAVWRYANKGDALGATERGHSEPTARNSTDEDSSAAPIDAHRMDGGRPHESTKGDWFGADAAPGGPNQAVASTDSAIASSEPTSPKEREERLQTLIIRVSDQLDDHPRVAVLWTTVDHGNGRWLFETRSPLRLPREWMLRLVPIAFGYVLLIFVMVAIPNVDVRKRLRERMRATLRRRRGAIAISGVGLVSCISLVICSSVWRAFERAGTDEVFPSSIAWACAIGCGQCVLGCLVARSTPFDSSVARLIHITAGAIVGLLGSALAVVMATLLLPILALYYRFKEDPDFEDWIIGGVFVLWMCLGFCPAAAMAAGRGRSIFRRMAEHVHDPGFPD